MFLTLSGTPSFFLSQRIHVALAMIAACILAPAASAADAWPACTPARNAVEMRILEQLGEDTKMPFIDTPLEDVVAFLRDQHDIPIELDTRSMDDVGLSVDTPMTRNIKGISLSSALQLLLRNLDMTYVVHGEVLLLTTVDAAPKYARLRVYDVSKLVGDSQDAIPLGATLTQALRGTGPGNVMYGGMAGGMGQGGVYGGMDMGGGGFASGPGAAGPPAQAILPQIIPYKHLLIVRETTLGHQRVAELLAALAAAP